MLTSLPFNLAAILSIIPVAIHSLGKGRLRDARYWLTMALAVLGPFALVISEIAAHGWQKSFGFSLWVTVTATMGLFATLSLLEPNAHRLTPLVAPYMAVLALSAMIWGQFEGAEPLSDKTAVWGWVEIHIVVSVTTYGLVTLAAMAALAGLLQERILKAKKRSALTRLLPSVADADNLLFKMLTLGEIVLGIGLATGMAIHHSETGSILSADHKTVLTIAAFVVIGLMLLAHRVSGLRGRTVTRLVLLAYLLLTMGYPGVKFIADHLLFGA